MLIGDPISYVAIAAALVGIISVFFAVGLNERPAKSSVAQRDHNESASRSDSVLRS